MSGRKKAEHQHQAAGQLMSLLDKARHAAAQPTQADTWRAEVYENVSTPGRCSVIVFSVGLGTSNYGPGYYGPYWPGGLFLGRGTEDECYTAAEEFKRLMNERFGGSFFSS